MINSMTGYGRSAQVIDGREISVEVKSVNHRFFEFSSRVPRSLGYLDEKLKQAVHGHMSRGKVDVSVTVVVLDGNTTQVEINHGLAESYLSAIRALGRELYLDDDITLSGLVRFGDIFVMRRQEEDQDAVWDGVDTVLQQALEAFLQMRRAEGEKLAQDIAGRLLTIEGYVAQVAQRSPQTVADYRARLTAKLEEVLQNRNLEEQRILTEAALFAERVAVDEETVRLSSHISQFRAIMAQGGPVGRKLDFLVQEINREANTIGSKVQDMQIAHIVVELKSEIEKIREQIQNLE